MAREGGGRRRPFLFSPASTFYLQKSHKEHRAMTIEQIKEQLPPVRVCFQGQEVEGRVCGRMEHFATVWIENIPEYGAAFSWKAIQRAINEKLVLQFTTFSSNKA
jgi:hypothetical protein